MSTFSAARCSVMVRARWSMLVTMENTESYGRVYVNKRWKGPVRSTGRKNMRAWCARPLTKSEGMFLLKPVYLATLLATNMGNLKTPLREKYHFLRGCYECHVRFSHFLRVCPGFPLMWPMTSGTVTMHRSRSLS